MENDLILTQQEKVQQAKSVAYLLLILTAFGWSLSTVLCKVCISTISAAHILMARAAIASVAIFFIAPKKITAADKAHVKSGLTLGLIVFCAYYFGVICLKYTTASKAGFLMAFNVLLVPAIEAVIKKRLPSKWIVISVGISLIGLQLISGINGTGFNFGDFLAFLCAVFYSIYTIALGRWGRDKDDIVLSFFQTAALGVCAFLAVVLFEGIDLQGIRMTVLPLLLMGVVGMALPTFFQTKAQKTASTESVGIILLADPLFTLILAALFLREPIFLSGLIGGGLIL
ncbi:MAG TPA: DMT family transporter, partial [Clostridia bacterium]|nr:DMT family transporter [Clostridia bacterium]